MVWRPFVEWRDVREGAVRASQKLHFGGTSQTPDWTRVRAAIADLATSVLRRPLCAAGPISAPGARPPQLPRPLQGRIELPTSPFPEVEVWRSPRLLLGNCLVDQLNYPGTQRPLRGVWVAVGGSRAPTSLRTAGTLELRITCVRSVLSAAERRPTASRRARAARAASPQGHRAARCSNRRSISRPPPPGGGRLTGWRLRSCCR